MNRLNFLKSLSPALAAAFLLSSCGGDSSNTTGWSYNDSDNGGFSVNTDYEGQETGPGLVFVEGGTFTMGRVEQDVYQDWDNIPRQVSVQSFYIDENEITNTDYREYLYWIRRVFDIDYYPEILTTALL